MFKKIKIGLLIFILGFISFYFWGSVSPWSKSEYAQVVNYSSFSDQTTDTIKVMTFNIGYLSGMTNNIAVERSSKMYEDHLQGTIHLLNNWNGHIIGFQEIDFDASRSFNVDQLDALASQCNFHQAAYAVNWNKNYVPFPYWPPSAHFGKVVSGQAILSKFPVVDNSIITLKKPDAPFYYNQFYIDRLIQTSIVTINNREVAVVNVHLEAFQEVTRFEQAHYMVEVLETLREKYPLIITGDFNAQSSIAATNDTGETTMDFFHRLTWLADAISPERFFENEAAYHTFSSEKPYERIDYIFYTTADFELIESRVMTEAGTISDHLPVVATLLFKTND